MTWTVDETARLVDSYYAYWTLTHADQTAPRKVVDQHWWAVERVAQEEQAGTLPMAVIDALLKAPGSDEHYRSFVAAGPLEVLLEHHGERYGAPIAAKCQTDPLWAEAAGGVWLGRQKWEALPQTLQRLVPEPEPEVTKARRTRKRPSKRQ